MYQSNLQQTIEYQANLHPTILCFAYQLQPTQNPGTPNIIPSSLNKQQQQQQQQHSVKQYNLVSPCFLVSFVHLAITHNHHIVTSIHLTATFFVILIVIIIVNILIFVIIIVVLVNILVVASLVIFVLSSLSWTLLFSMS